MFGQILSSNFEVFKIWSSTWIGHMETVSVISGRADKSPPTGFSPTFSSFIKSFCLYIFLQQHFVQGGYNTNLAPAKLMGKLFTLFDNTAHRVVGGLPPPVPATSQGHAHQPGGPSVSNNQSTMGMSSLMPSASMEPISEWTAESNQLNIPNRSISEPDFGRSPGKVDKCFCH